MPFADQSAPDPGRFTTASPVSITISQPQSSTAEKIAGLSAILSAHYGADAAISCITFTTQLHEAVKTLDAANELVAREHEVGIPDTESGDPIADVSPDCYARYEEKMRTAAASFLAAADAVGELANSELLTPAILRGLPRRLLCSIIRAGLEAEADELLDILDTVNTPPAIDGDADGQS